VAQTANTVAQESTGDRPCTETTAPSPPPATTTSTPQKAPKPIAVPEVPSPWDEPDKADPPIKREMSAPATNPPASPELWLHSTASLAKRLNVTSQAITRHRTQSDFSTWTQMQDPEGIAWSYDASSQSFYPFTTLASPLEKPVTDTKPSPDATSPLQTRIEETPESIGAITGKEVGAVMGELLGEMTLDPVGAVVGEEIGAVVGEMIGAEVGKLAVEDKQEIEAAKPAGKSTAQKNATQTNKTTSDIQETPLTSEESEPIEDGPKPTAKGRKTASKTTARKQTGKRSPGNPLP
jgi:uncharacterized membrane protein